jgi:hypothetical protein
MRAHLLVQAHSKIASSVNISNREEMSRRLKTSYSCFTFPMFSSSFSFLLFSLKTVTVFIFLLFWS